MRQPEKADEPFSQKRFLLPGGSNMKHKLVATTFLLFFLISLFPAMGFAGSAILRWKQNSDSDLAGYRIYFGTRSRSYGPYVPVGKEVTSYKLNGLSEGKTYYFALTAVDKSGNESGYSNEVSKVISASGNSSTSKTSSVSDNNATLKKIAPSLNIKINGQYGEITVKEGDPVHVVVTMGPGDYYGQMADWWLYATLELDGKVYEYSYVYPKDWYIGRFLSYRGLICPVRPLDMTFPKLVAGIYTVFFSVDSNADRRRDNTWQVSARIIVTKE